LGSAMARVVTALKSLGAPAAARAAC
jgi:hypothetical protein